MPPAFPEDYLDDPVIGGIEEPLVIDGFRSGLPGLVWSASLNPVTGMVETLLFPAAD